MRSRLGPCSRFLLGLACALVFLPGIAALWWLFPPRPRASWDTGPCRSVYVSADGRTVITEYETEITLWDLKTGTRRGVLDRAPVRGQLTAERPRSAPGDPPALDLWPTPDGNGVVYRETRHDAAGLVLWPGAGHTAQLLPGAVDVATFTADGRAVIVRTDEGLTVVALATGREVPGPPNRPRAMHAQAIAGGAVLSVESDGRTLTVRDQATGTACGSVPAPGQPFQVTLSGDGRALATADADSAQVWDLPAGKRRCAVSYAPQDWVRSLAELNADGSRMLLRIRSTRLDPAPALAVWDVTAHPARPLNALPTSAAAARTASFSPDGRWVLQQDLWTGNEEVSGAAGVWEASTLRSHLTLSRGGWCGAARLGPRGRTVAAAWSTPDVPSPRWLDRLPGYSRPAPKVSDFADTFLCIRVWDLAEGRELAVFPDVGTFAYLPDGSGLVIWRAEPGLAGVSAPGAPVDGVIEVWDQPPRRPAWVDYGLPALFALTLLVCARFIRGAWHGCGLFFSRATVPTGPTT